MLSATVLSDGNRSRLFTCVAIGSEKHSKPSGRSTSFSMQGSVMGVSGSNHFLVLHLNWGILQCCDIVFEPLFPTLFLHLLECFLK